MFTYIASISRDNPCRLNGRRNKSEAKKKNVMILCEIWLLENKTNF